MVSSHDTVPWFAHFDNYVASNLVPLDFAFHQSKKFMHDVKKFFLDEPSLFCICTNGMIHRFEPKVEMMSILEVCHSSPVDRHHSNI